MSKQSELISPGNLLGKNVIITKNGEFGKIIFTLHQKDTLSFQQCAQWFNRESIDKIKSTDIIARAGTKQTQQRRFVVLLNNNRDCRLVTEQFIHLLAS